MNSTRPPMPSFRETVKYWLKLGFISFGGPAGQISMMHQELVERRRWISEHRFMHAMNYTMVLPGPEAQQLATYIGWLMHGTKGGIAAGVLFVLPSLFIIIGLSWIYMSFGDINSVKAVLLGVKAAVIAIIIFAVYRIGSKALGNSVTWAIAGLAFCTLFFLKVPFPFVIVGAGIIGFLGSKFAPQRFTSKGHHGESGKKYGPAVIDDDTPLAAHTLFSWPRAIMIGMIGLFLWLSVMSILYFNKGDNATLSDMGFFFTNVALWSFGGAYAVLDFAREYGVDLGWLTKAQMVDGIALGETTPGPLIMVMTYVGFVGAWTKAALGPNLITLGAIAGGLVATFFTFLPSFLFILIGAPKIEATRHNIKLTAPLVAITAAVVGVIFNLAMNLSKDVFWPKHMAGAFDWYSLVICLVTFLLLYRFKVGIIPVIGLGSLAGAATMLF